MRIFITGASGHIGSLTTAALIAAGHQVVGLTRSQEGSFHLSELGAEPLLGDLDNPEPIAEAAATADGVVHLAFKHDWGNFNESIRADRAVIGAIADALAGSGKPFLVASGTLALADIQHGAVGTEMMAAHAEPRANPRAATESAVLALKERGISSAALRFAPTVHGPADAHGFIPALIDDARRNGYSAYVGDGENRWPAVHELDIADMIRLALEHKPSGVALHGVGDGGIPFRRIAEAIGRGVKVPTQSVEPQDAAASVGFLGDFIALDNPVSSELTQCLLGWTPSHPGLLDDLSSGFYFER